VIRVETVAAGDRADSPFFKASVDRDGKFRIDDMPAGDDAMTVRVDRDDPGHLRNHRFRVPPAEGDAAECPLDLGTLRLEKPSLLVTSPGLQEGRKSRGGEPDMLANMHPFGPIPKSPRPPLLT
jgi:hypothetical protein